MKRIRSMTAALAAVLTVAGLTLAVAPAQPAQAITCGTWRWQVKTGADADRFKVSQTVDSTTVGHLRSLTAPSSFPTFYQTHRFRGAERHTWQLTARLTQYREEDDGDIHLVLRNSAGKDMIAEIPLGRCVALRSLWKSRIAAARATFTSHDPVSTSWHFVNQTITLRGLGFFDEIHNVTGQAPNGMELHPVTRVRFP